MNSPCVGGNLIVVQGWTFSLWEWPIPTQLLVWGTLFAVRCNPLSGRWDPGGWVMVNVCNRVQCHWQYTTLARSSCRREVRNGPTWSIGWSRQAQEPTNFVLLIIAKNKHCVIHFVLVALGVNQVIFILIAWVCQPCIPGMTVWRLSAAACPLVGLCGGWGHGWWIQRQFNMSQKITNNQTDGTRKKRVRTEVSDSSMSDEESKHIDW